MNKPKFCIDQIVSFLTHYGIKTGIIEIIDPNGYFGSSTKEPSYDIFVESENIVYKHIDESYIINSECHPKS